MSIIDALILFFVFSSIGIAMVIRISTRGRRRMESAICSICPLRSRCEDLEEKKD